VSRRGHVAAAGAIIAGVSLWRCERGEPDDEAARDGAAAAAAAVEQARPSAPPAAMSPPRTAAASSAPAALPPVPHSLTGTEVDGGFATDDGGAFVATLSARRLFDYFLSAEGEEPAEVIRARVAAEAARQLAPAGAAAAVALYDRYCAYRAAGAAMFATDAERGDPRAALTRLRRDYFGDDAAALFADTQ
jgi:lipase chaperone LimK